MFLHFAPFLLIGRWKSIFIRIGFFSTRFWSPPVTNGAFFLPTSRQFE